MIKIKSTYNYFGITNQSKQLIVFCFILLLGTKPITNITLFFTEDKYELLEILSLKKSDQKENQNIGIDESEKLLYPLFNYQTIYLKSSLSYFNMQINYINIISDIQLQPPKIYVNYFFILTPYVFISLIL